MVRACDFIVLLTYASSMCPSICVEAAEKMGETFLGNSFYKTISFMIFFQIPMFFFASGDYFESPPEST